MSKISAGGHDLNRFFYGGYDCDVITMLYGGPGTGKTNLCLLAAVSQAKKGNKVIYVDTEGGFSSERVRQMVNENGVEKVLGNIFLLKPTNFKEQKESFVQLLKYLKKGISLVIVDGMTMLYRLEFADAREKNLSDFESNGKFSSGDRGELKLSDRGGLGHIQKVNAELTRQMRTLAEIARKQNIPVIVTNQVYSWDNESKMVGGDILKYWSKCLVELTNDRGKRMIYLRKHRSLGEKSFTFVIDDFGVKKRGWI